MYFITKKNEKKKKKQAPRTNDTVEAEQQILLQRLSFALSPLCRFASVYQFQVRRSESVELISLRSMEHLAGAIFRIVFLLNSIAVMIAASVTTVPCTEGHFDELPGKNPNIRAAACWNKLILTNINKLPIILSNTVAFFPTELFSPNCGGGETNDIYISFRD